MTTVANGQLELDFGQTSDGVIVESGGTLVVLSGGTALDTTVSSGGTAIVSSGGAASFTAVSSGGSEIVSSGGQTLSTTVSGGGFEIVSSGGTASFATLSGSGYEVVSAGGSAVDTVVSSGGTESVSSGGAAGFTAVSSGGAEFVFSSGTAVGAIVDSGGSLTVSSGGTLGLLAGTILSGVTTIQSGGTLDVGSGVTVGDGTPIIGISGGVAAGITVDVLSGGFASGLTVSAQGALNLLSGGTASVTTLSGGLEDVSAGGTSIDATISAGGEERVSAGGTASLTIVSSGGTEIVSAGGAAIGTSLADSGFSLVTGGVASNTSVGAGGFELVSGGGEAVSTTVGDGGSQGISGGTARFTTVGDGGYGFVSSGGSAVSTTVSSGGTVVVSSFGATSDTILSQGDEIVAGGATLSTTVDSGGSEIVSAGGTASFAAIDNGGIELVSSGGSAISTSVAGGTAVVSSAGVAASTTVSSGGAVVVSSFGAASFTAISSGGAEIVSSGGVASFTAISSGGVEIVSSGGTTLAPGIGDGGTEIILSGGAANAATVSSGALLEAFGNATFSGTTTTISAGGTFDAASGFTVGDGTPIAGLNGGVQTDVTVQILSGGAANGLSVSAQGGLDILSGGSASFTTLSGGSAYVSSGGTAVGTTVSAGGLDILSGGTASFTTISAGGAETVAAGGTAVSTTLDASGAQYVAGTALFAVLSAGAAENVLAGGVASGTTVSGGVVAVSSGGTTVDATLSGGGERISSGGTARLTTISAGGSAIVSSGGTAISTTISSGGGQSVLGAAAVASFTAISSGGSETISAHGETISTTVSRGGTQGVASGGTAVSTTVDTGGYQFVSHGGLATAATIDSGGHQIVSGVASTTFFLGSGTEEVYAGGTAVSAMVGGGGFLAVSDGGIASSTTILGASGFEVVSDGGSAVGATISGGRLVVQSGGGVTGTVLFAGVSGTLEIDGVGTSGNLLPGATIAGFAPSDIIDLDIPFDANGTITLGSGNVLSLTEGGETYTLDLRSTDNFSGDMFLLVPDGSGDTEIVAPKIVTAGPVQPNQILIVSARQISTGIAVSGGGYLLVESGGSASQATVSKGGLEIVSAGGTESSATLIGGTQYIHGTDSFATISKGTQYVFGTAISTTIDSGGNQSAYGIASATIVEHGGVADIIGGSAIDAVVNGGQLFDSRGTDIGTTLESGGTEDSIFGQTTAPTIESGGRLIVIDGSVSDVTVSGGGSLEFFLGTTASGAINFSGTGGLLQFDRALSPGLFLPQAVISGFAAGDTIDLLGVDYDPTNSIGLGANNQLQFTEGGSQYELDFSASQNFAGDLFHLAADTGGGTDITETACYCRGTLILTPTGDVPVEELQIGQHVVTLSGETKPIKWIGRRSYSGRFLAGNRDVLPVGIAIGAFADGIPERDLWVSPEHSLFLDDVLVPARLLVNDVTVVQPEDTEAVEYFHIELDEHDIIFAESTPAETFLDDNSRFMFHNAPEFHALYPNAPQTPTAYCAPRLEEGAALEELRRALRGRSRRLADGSAAPSSLQGNIERVTNDRIEGWAFDPDFPEAPVAVVFLADGAVIGRAVADRFRPDLQVAGIGDGHHSFAFTVPSGFVGATRRQIELCYEIDWTPLPGSPARLEPTPTEPEKKPAAPPPAPRSPAAPLPSPPAEASLGALSGVIDVASHARIAGWVQDLADPERPVGLIIRANGQVIGRLLANRYRSDLAKEGIGSGRHGFELLIPNGLSALRAQEIRIRREADGAEHPGSPITLPASTGFDPVLEQNLAGIFAQVGADADEERALAFLTRETDRLLARRAARDSGRAAREAYRLHRRRWGQTADAPEPGPPRALVVDDRVPQADRDAGSVAILSHMRALRALGYEVNFVASREIAKDGAALAAENITLCGAPLYSCVEDVLSRQAASFDLVYLHRAANADKYLSLSRGYNPKARLIYSVADLHYLRVARQAQAEARPELAALSRLMAATEILACRRADLVITHSPVEAEILRREIGPAKVHVVPFDVPVRGARQAFANRHGVAVIGSFAHAPNPDAVHFMLREILPLVWAKDPNLTCRIVGHGWSEERLPGLDERVIVAGAVEDLDALLDTVRLTVAPLRFGAGIKGKVLDSFAAALPCVMSPIAAEGLPLSATLQELVGNSAAAIAELIVRYHTDETANLAAGAEAAQLVAQEFTNQRVLQALNTALNGGAAQNLGKDTTPAA